MSLPGLNLNNGSGYHSETPSSNLWIGSLSGNVTEAELTAIFGKYGAVEGVACYPARNFAFVYFKRLEDATAAKNALQGKVIGAIAIKIQFARPPKQCKRLWVGEISPSISKEELEEEFLKYGKLEDFKFLRARNTAFVDYVRQEDASKAVESLNGKQIHGQHLRVDFFRSHSSRREQWPDFHDSGGQILSQGINQPDSRWLPQNLGGNYSEALLTTSNRQQNSQPSVWWKADGQPSNTLWIGYPPSFHVDEMLLRNALILYGEIERVRCFPELHCSFVEFRSVDEACLAKEKLQSRMFNGSSLRIMFSSSELVPGNTYNCSALNLPTNSAGPISYHGGSEKYTHSRILSNQGSVKPALSGVEEADYSISNKMLNVSPNSSMAAPSWKRSSPAPGMLLSSPSAAMNPTHASASSAWDVFDGSQIQRQPKRLRTEDSFPVVDASVHTEKLDNWSSELDQSHMLASDRNRGSPGSLSNARGATAHGHLVQDYAWRGILAKGGSLICHARVVSIGEGIGTEIPEVINCSARTGLDKLTKHYAEAVGFSVVFFLPDSEEDFVSYTEFLRYLADKNRAGVAKFEDGTTLFLVPPSDFLTEVLKVNGPERLYGVVLKFPQSIPTSVTLKPQTTRTRYVDGELVPTSQNERGVLHQGERVPHFGTNMMLHEDSHQSVQSVGPPVNMYPLAHSVPPSKPAGSVAGVTLTPELISTLASLLPANTKLAGLESAPLSLASSTPRPLLSPSLAINHEHQVTQPSVYSSQQTDNRLNPQAHLLPSTVYMAGASQDGHFANSLQVNLNNQHETPQSTVNSYGVEHGTEAYGLYASSIQKSGNSAVLSNQACRTSVSQSQTVMSRPADAMNSMLSNQMVPSTVTGPGQGTSEREIDKNLRYQSTVQFAANLLFQIQQQQRVNQTGQNSSDHC